MKRWLARGRGKRKGGGRWKQGRGRADGGSGAAGREAGSESGTARRKEGGESGAAGREAGDESGAGEARGRKGDERRGVKTGLQGERQGRRRKTGLAGRATTAERFDVGDPACLMRSKSENSEQKATFGKVFRPFSLYLTVNNSGRGTRGTKSL